MQQKIHGFFKFFFLDLHIFNARKKSSKNLLHMGGERWSQTEMPYEAWFRLLTFHFRKVVTCRFQRNVTNMTMERQPRMIRGGFPIILMVVTLQLSHVKQYFRGVPYKDIKHTLAWKPRAPSHWLCHVNSVVGIQKKPSQQKCDQWHIVTSWCWRFSWCFIPTPTRKKLFFCVSQGGWKKTPNIFISSKWRFVMVIYPGRKSNLDKQWQTQVYLPSPQLFWDRNHNLVPQKTSQFFLWMNFIVISKHPLFGKMLWTSSSNLFTLPLIK